MRAERNFLSIFFPNAGGGRKRAQVRLGAIAKIGHHPGPDLGQQDSREGDAVRMGLGFTEECPTPMMGT